MSTRQGLIQLSDGTPVEGFCGELYAEAERDNEANLRLTLMGM